MRAKEKTARGGNPSAVYKNNSAQIIPLRAARRNCAVCGIPFRPRGSWHRLCDQCHRWIVAAQQIAAAAKALRGAR